MNRIGFGLLCIMLVTASSNVMLQTADHSAFIEVFKTYSKQSEFGGRLFGELLMMVQKGETLQSLNDHVEELRKHLADDESEDEKYFNEKQQEMEATFSGLANEVEELRVSVEQAASRIQVLNNQQTIIDGLFANDQQAYQKRVGDQNAILDVIGQLLLRVSELQQGGGHSLIEKDNLLDEIKALGRGKHIEVLAQITAHLQTEQVEHIQELLNRLRDAVLNSLAIDEEKEQENIRLYNKLSGEIRSSLAQSDRLYQELDAHFQQKELELNTKKLAVREVGQTLQDRNDQRQFILDRVQEAQKLLNDNLDRIARWSVESE
ncbi:unnamed protein product [Paramecium primaurelia]|uniref:Uncharacterized protein n=1 Tax=Paramecium primaurelia TaxID=5886 RepID=A0A8S1QED3_PARPR|nr:unnamed protein product [Paramecium primaurelia]CAD8113718.1 unnamed protein product [Paramecium primaurelia]